MPYVQTKDLPNSGQPFEQIRRKLEALGIKEVRIQFADKASGLGSAWNDHGRVDVYLFKGNEVSGWEGSYGGSYAAMYSKDLSAQATAGQVHTEIPSGCAALEVNYYSQKRWAKLILNPECQNKLLPPAEEVSKRLLQILACFRLKPFARPEYLLRAKVTQEDLDELVKRGWLKPFNGKHPTINGSNIDLAGCKMTTEGKNACEGTSYY